ncbi:UNVERIFIED_CONTAM: hypothetical protein Sangu_2046500 [Sesamum angustifolium]|uniref:Uncharacterized protein n=1 Tax=Sesamum angustifolium TaxID=2727405 RepID=A0AAW2LIY9_9LAMI
MAHFVLVDGELCKHGFSQPLLMPNSQGRKLRFARDSRGNLWKRPWGEGLSSKSCKARFLLANNAPRYPGDGKMLSCVPRARKHQSPTSCTNATRRKPLPVRSMGNGLSWTIPVSRGTKKVLDRRCCLLHKMGRS